MSNQKEITALLHLLEDPDIEVFEAVSNRIISYGPPMIAELENLWENTISGDIQQKIEILIHRLHFSGLITDFKQWSQSPHQELLPGLLLVAKFLYPDLQSEKVFRDVDRLRHNIWLELNNYLTPLEQIHVLNSIIYKYFGLKGTYNNKDRPNEFLIHSIIESKKGNQTGNGTLYLLLTELLDIPVKLISIPKQFVLAYYKPLPGNSPNTQAEQAATLKIDFFIDPVTGQAFTHNDLNNYFDRLGMAVLPKYFIPQNNKQITQKLLEDFSSCFSEDNQLHMQQEIKELISLLE